MQKKVPGAAMIYGYSATVPAKHFLPGPNPAVAGEPEPVPGALPSTR